MRISIRTGALAFALTSPALAQTVNFTVNPAQTQAISPYIYGINGDLTGDYSNNTLLRSGGNRLTAYNWENNASNAGSDWYFQNDNLMGATDEAGWAGRTKTRASPG